MNDAEIDEAYGTGYEDGYDEGEFDGIELERYRIRDEVKLLVIDELIDNEDWLDGLDTMRKLVLNIIEGV